MNHLLHSVYEEKESWDLFQTPAWLFRAKAGSSSAGMGVILWKWLCMADQGLCKGDRDTWSIGQWPCPLCPFSLLHGLSCQKHCGDQGLWGLTWEALWCWKVSYKCSDLTTGISCLKCNYCCKVDLLTPVVVANSATSFSYESQSTLKWKDSELEFLTNALERGGEVQR